MEYVHRSFIRGETIAAVATPPGEGGVAIIRISGNQAVEIASKIFTGQIKSYRSHTAHFGKIVGSDGKVIDEVLLLPMLAPRSYTGEDVVEIHCHGGSLITRRVLEAVLQAGARAAQPGEFTLKAFLNGKIDLAQAEGVQALIAARNDLALTAAEQQLQGMLSEEIRSFQKELVDIAAILEAAVDFPDEGLEFATIDQVTGSLKNSIEKMEKKAATFEEGRRISEGLMLCLTGSPNVGKSSLMNVLLCKERAIVTAIAGTTRDLLEEEMKLGKLHVRLVDTAGIRKTTEIIEQEGIRRSKLAIDSADIILLVLDASRDLHAEDHNLIQEVPKEKTILVWNKIDLTFQKLPSFDFPKTVFVSAKDRLGIDALKKAIDELIWEKGAPSKEEIVITNVRHYQALKEAISAGNMVIEGLEGGISPEFVASDMRKMLFELATIIGTDITEDILDAIFSKFCVGK